MTVVKQTTAKMNACAIRMVAQFAVVNTDVGAMQTTITWLASNGWHHSNSSIYYLVLKKRMARHT